MQGNEKGPDAQGDAFRQALAQHMVCIKNIDYVVPIQHLV